MAPRRLIACCLGLLAAAILMLGCGSSDSTSADIDPAVSSDFTNKLAVIRGYAADGECDKSTEALATLKLAVDQESGQTGEQFTTDLQELLDELNAQIVDQCQPPEQTSTSSSTESSTDTEPTISDTSSTESSTTSTTKETSTTSTTKDTSTTTTPPTPPTPPTGGGNGNNPGGGISPGGKKQAGGPPSKKPKADKSGKHSDNGKGPKHHESKEHGR